MSDNPEFPNVVALRGDGKTSHLAEAVRETEKNMPALLRFAQLHAQLQRASFDALVEEGFTDDQALSLLMTIEL